MIYALLQYDFLVLYPINPKSFAAYRETFRISGAKDEGRFKLIDWYDEDRRELFDLINDPGEKKDLSSEMPEKLGQMYEQLKEWRSQVSAIQK